MPGDDPPRDGGGPQSSCSALVVLVLASQLLFSGCPFGYAALQLVLEREGEYSELCASAGPDGCAPVG